VRIVVTGATGNVGLALLRRLATEPDIEVVGIVRNPPSPDAGPPYDRVRWHRADVSDPQAVPQLVECLRGADAVVHLAWQIQPASRRATLRRINLTGTRHVVEAMLEAGVWRLAFASSVAVYAPGPKNRAVDELWPLTGLQGSAFSTDKAAVEAFLDRIEREQPDLRVVRMRQALVLQYAAASQTLHYFAGHRHPRLRRALLPVLPRNKRLRGQVIHADDLAEAYLLALRGGQVGAFNLAADPVLDGRMIAEELGRRSVPVPLPVLRVLRRVFWRLRLLPNDASWLEVVAAVPIMDCSRAARELGWRPQRSATEAFHEVIVGARAGAGAPATPLRLVPGYEA
jgi:UDP-glucose 4-epimerase